MFEPEVTEALTVLMATVAEDSPEMMAVLNEIKHGETSQEEGMTRLIGMLQENPQLSDALKQAAAQVFAPLRAAGELIKPTTPTGPGILFDSGVGLLRLNPLFEAALIDRAQFDGDIPELRTGPLPPETMPAVPVDSDARSPVALGRMLDDASSKVMEEVAEARQKRMEYIEKLETGGDLSTALADLNTTSLALARGDAASDPPSYRRGQVPAPLKVPQPSGSVLASLSSYEQAQDAFKFISTTQGRRTARKTISSLVAENLRQGGIDIEESTKPPEGIPAAASSWTVTLGGSLAIQSTFSYVDVAGRALSTKLLKELDGAGGSFVLTVLTIDTIDARSVGWGAQLVPA